MRGASPRRPGRAAVVVIALVAFAVPAWRAPSADAMAASGNVIGLTGPVSATAAINNPQRFVPNVVVAFNALSRRPDALAFKRGSAPEAGICKHYQGIARAQGADGTPYLFMTRSGNIPWYCDLVVDAGDGFLQVARMGSRDDNGERMRSNLWPSGLLPASGLGDDTWVSTMLLDGANGWPGYQHPGGMQIVDDVLVIGTENPTMGGARATVLFVDISDPEAPQFIRQFDPPDLDGAANAEFGADPVGLTAIPAEDGTCCRYLMIVAGGPGNKDVRFFRSLPMAGTTTSDLKSPELEWEQVGRYTESQIESCLGADWPTGLGPQHQMLNFVREGSLDGPLFLIGGRNGTNFVGAPFGDEYTDLYEVQLGDGSIPEACPLVHVNTRQMGATGHGAYDIVANFAAASGGYVSPSGELMIYATPHDSTAGGVFFGEYRHHNMVRADSPTLHPTASVDGPFVVDEGSAISLTGQGEPAITKAWIQVFEEDDAQHRIDSFLDREPWLPVEYPDRNADAFDELDLFGAGARFNWAELVTSWRWFAPVGCTISANDFPRRSADWPGDDTVLLRGSGAVVVATDLEELEVYRSTPTSWPVSPVPLGATPQQHDFDNDLEGITFHHVDDEGNPVADCDAYYTAPISLGWDLDDDGSFETGGTSVSFSAAALDGPMSATVQARAVHPTDTSSLGTGSPVAVPIAVRNVAPQIGSATVTDSLGNDLDGATHVAVAGMPVTLAMTFTDPGLADTQTASIDWGDGSPVDTSFATFSDAGSGLVGVLEDARVFAAPGSYRIAATVSDDDGGATTAEFTIEVLSLEGAIESVAETLTELIDQTIDAATASALRDARDNLIGNLGGTPPTNGAADKLDADDPVGAITKIRAALSDIIAAETSGAGDLSALKDLLGLVAEGIATVAHTQAMAAVSPPSPREARTLATIAELITSGHDRLVNGQYLDACHVFRQATEKSLALLR